MRSRTSFFNKTIYKKNLTRFAPVWGLYTLCLTLGVALLYSNGGSMRQFHFTFNYLYDLFSVMAVVNLGYALLVAQLLFGDLFNSRMCNMLHAFPVSRESWFVTNVVSGLTFSLVPTAVMAVVSVPLLMGSIFEGAAALAFWLFLASNLEFICLFGLAVFAAMCTANRFTMAAGYGLLNAGAMIAYWLVDTVYTPMLYGVITPTQLMWNLTPLYHAADRSFAETEVNLYDLRKEFGDKLEGAVAQFTLTDEWWHLWLIAGIGIAFLVLALVLYKKRDLECAGDAVAFRWLVPVFEVLCAVFVATAAQYSLENLLNVQSISRWVLILSLAVGWFVAKMLVERSARVFRVKNCTGLVILAVVFGISLALTHFDVLGIEDKIPEAARVKKVSFGTNWTANRDMESPEDIEAMLQLHQLALAERAENSGGYVKGFDGSWVKYVDTNDHLYQVELSENRMIDGSECTHVAEVSLNYELENGKIIKRRYNVWVDSEAGRITNDYLNDWKELDFKTLMDDGREVSRIELAMEDFRLMNIDYMDERELPEVCFDKAAALELLSCIDRDLQEGHMAQHPYFHNGVFQKEEELADSGYVQTESRSISFSGQKYSWHVDIYPDAVHTIKWLEDHDLLDWEILEDQKILW